MKKVSWRFNLTLLIVLLLSVSLFFQLFYVIPYIRSGEIEEERNHEEADASNIAVFLNMKIQKSIDDLQVMAGDSDFFDMDYDNQSATLRQYLEQVPLTSIFAMDSEGWFVSSSQTDISAWQTRAYPDLDTFRIPFEEGEIYFNDPRAYFEGTQVRVSFAVPVLSDSDEPIGVMTSGIYLNEIIDWVKGFSLEEGTTAYIVDLRGIVIAHSEIDVFGLEEGPLSLNYSDRPLVKDFLEGRPVRESEYTYDGEQHYGALTKVDSVEWGVIVEMSVQYIMGNTNVLSGQLLTLNVILFIVALPLALFFTRQITVRQNRMDEELRSRNVRLEELLGERERSAAQLELSEEHFRILVEGTKDYAIFMLSPEGLISTWNQGAENIKGYTADEVTGKHYSLFYIEEDVKTGKPEEQLKIAREEGRYVDEGLRIRKDGTRFWANVVITALYDDAGVLNGFSKVTRDITERKRMDAKLRNYNERLEEMVDEKTEELVKAERFAAIGRISSIIGHELRNPLAVIKNSVFFLNLKLEKDADENIIRNMQLIDREVNRSNTIISDLLDFARGPKQPLIQQVDIDNLVQEAISRINIPEGVEVKTSPGEMSPVKADPDMILRIFLNLLSNGVDAMPKGGVLTVETEANNGDIVISIHDTGEGISEENLEKLFTPLFSTKVKGVGLGLYITKSLVEAHDGTISVDSVEGEGTTFTIRMPIREAD